MPSPLELVAPAGSQEALRAAVCNGADAVYFGLSTFSARARAANFAVESLPEVTAYLRAHNVRGYLALNTLIFSDELPQVVELLKAAADAGVDAVIVQDLGLVKLIRRLTPSLPIFASTQMTIAEPRAMEFVRRLGVRRVILPRELSLAEIRRIAEASDMELEVFVHGALCMSYSGQCLASESLGGRSANRGQCAQPCRLPYQMLADGRPLVTVSGGPNLFGTVPNKLGPPTGAPPGQMADIHLRAYLLSPRDLAAYDRIADLVKVGVRSFKIEGRLKSAQYVAAVVRAYRAALDAAAAGQRFSPTPEQQAELAQGFSRGFTHGFLDGPDHRSLVDGHSPKSRGLRIGRVVGKTQRGVLVEMESPEARLKPGDGVVFDVGRPEQDEEGGRVFEARAQPASSVAELVFRRGDVNLAAVPIGSAVWKTDDPEVGKRLEQTYARVRVAKPTPLTARVRAARGEPLQITFREDVAREATVTGNQPLERAAKHPLTVELLREQLGRLGGTPFVLQSVEANPLDPVMVPKSLLNDLRRQAVAALVQLRDAAARHAIAETDALDAIRRTRMVDGSWSMVNGAQPPAAPAINHEPSTINHLAVLVRTLDQLDAVLKWTPPPHCPRLALAYGDFGDLRLCKQATARGKAAGLPIGLATPRIIKPGEERFLEQILDAGTDAVLARNLAALSFFRDRAPHIPLVADFSLNAVNDLSAGVLADAGVTRLTPGYDLNWQQMSDLLGRVDAGLFEIVIHQHIPMFHTEHCLFAAHLSSGRDHRSCGRPCRHKVELRDRVRAEHPVQADAGCRNTVFNAVAQSAAEFVQEMQRLGIRHFRLELLRESPAQAHALLDCYARLLAGLVAPDEAWRRLRGILSCVPTRGTLEMA
ncbi:MAG: U32 family peptidase [Planctomycetes bacterium]|nr:U32 family peptidase [Planctomycetota bacterium]